MEKYLRQKVSLPRKIFGHIANPFLIFLFLPAVVLISMNRHMTGDILTW
jgi:hypothetical protein